MARSLDFASLPDTLVPQKSYGSIGHVLRMRSWGLELRHSKTALIGTVWMVAFTLLVAVFIPSAGDVLVRLLILASGGIVAAAFFLQYVLARRLGIRMHFSRDAGQLSVFRGQAVNLIFPLSELVAVQLCCGRAFNRSNVYWQTSLVRNAPTGLERISIETNSEARSALRLAGKLASALGVPFLDQRRSMKQLWPQGSYAGLGEWVTGVAIALALGIGVAFSMMAIDDIRSVSDWRARVQFAKENGVPVSGLVAEKADRQESESYQRHQVRLQYASGAPLRSASEHDWLGVSSWAFARLKVGQPVGGWTMKDQLWIVGEENYSSSQAREFFGVAAGCAGIVVTMVLLHLKLRRRRLTRYKAISEASQSALP